MGEDRYKIKRVRMGGQESKTGLHANRYKIMGAQSSTGIVACSIVV